MRIAINRSQPGFWAIYFVLHFLFLFFVLLFVRFLWALSSNVDFNPNYAELLFECLVYAVVITTVRIIRYIIGKKRYEKNPVDRRRSRRSDE